MKNIKIYLSCLIFSSLFISSCQDNNSVSGSNSIFLFSATGNNDAANLYKYDHRQAKRSTVSNEDIAYISRFNTAHQAAVVMNADQGQALWTYEYGDGLTQVMMPTTEGSILVLLNNIIDPIMPVESEQTIFFATSYDDGQQGPAKAEHLLCVYDNKEKKLTATSINDACFDAWADDGIDYITPYGNMISDKFGKKIYFSVKGIDSNSGTETYIIFSYESGQITSYSELYMGQAPELFQCSGQNGRLLVKVGLDLYWSDGQDKYDSNMPAEQLSHPNQFSDLMSSFLHFNGNNIMLCDHSGTSHIVVSGALFTAMYPEYYLAPEYMTLSYNESVVAFSAAKQEDSSHSDIFYWYTCGCSGLKRIKTNGPLNNLVVFYKN